MEGSASVRILAAPEVVYDLLADITRMGEWSPECYRCEWVDGWVKAEPGARFRGYNRSGWIKWSNTSEIVVARRGRELSWIMGGLDKRYSLWRYAFASDDGGTVVTETFELLRHTLLGRIGALPLGGQRRRQVALVAGMESTLSRLRVAVETTAESTAD
jgi:uncharacterized protein YndB with AHSA1/START domain